MHLLAEILLWLSKSIKGGASDIERLGSSLFNNNLLSVALEYWPHVLIWTIITISISLILFYIVNKILTLFFKLDKKSHGYFPFTIPLTWIGLSIFLGVSFLTNQEINDFTNNYSVNSEHLNKTVVTQKSLIEENIDSIDFRKKISKYLGLEKSLTMEGLNSKNVRNRQLYLRSCFRSVIKNDQKFSFLPDTLSNFQENFGVSLTKLQYFLDLDLPLTKSKLEYSNNETVKSMIMNERNFVHCEIYDMFLQEHVSKFQ